MITWGTPALTPMAVLVQKHKYLIMGDVLSNITTRINFQLLHVLDIELLLSEIHKSWDKEYSFSVLLD